MIFTLISLKMTGCTTDFLPRNMIISFSSRDFGCFCFKYSSALLLRRRKPLDMSLVNSFNTSFTLPFSETNLFDDSAMFFKVLRNVFQFQFYQVSIDRSFPLSLLSDLSIQKLYLAFGEVSVESKVKCLIGELFVQLFMKLVIFQVNSLAAAPVGSLKKFSLKDNLFICFFILRANFFSYNTFLDFSLSQNFGGSSFHVFI